MAEDDNDPAHLCDAIGRLPDELLHTILEKLPLLDAVSTGFLSHRWRDLWKYVSVVEFDPSWVELTGKEIVSSLNQFICLHKGPKIRSFSVRFIYQPEMSTHVVSWVLFAINKHVENLDLDFDVGDTNIARNTAFGPCYKMFIKAPTAFQVAFMGSMPRSKYEIDEVSEWAAVYSSIHGMFGACGKDGINVLFKYSKVQNFCSINCQIPPDYLLQYEFQESRFLDIQDLGLELENLRTVQLPWFPGYYKGPGGD
ncbi:hypothetical protein GH714_040784 [Hevea brasiliensis]|uniref:F-box domain-containing protein n=1 Tax=Hevea brasiliensis TaxID=3981 RepID=A0A6A6MVK6_HEVBR|nr:hypothetical protein GH714_040784 [Hevea brasiliensis]